MNIQTAQSYINRTLNNRSPQKASAAKYFHQAITTIVIIDIAMIIMLSAPGNEIVKPIFLIMSLISAVVFVAEYILRVFSAGTYYKMKSWVKAAGRYMISFWGVIDFICILPFVLPYITGARNPDVIDLINFGRVLLIFKLIRYSKAFGLIKDTFVSVKNELFIGYFIALVVVTFAGVLMYYIEREAQPEKFVDIGEGLWWAIITFATVGYGDVYPITPMGKILASVIAFIGIGMIALPSGIISSAFMRRVGAIKDSGGTGKIGQAADHFHPSAQEQRPNNHANNTAHAAVGEASSGTSGHQGEAEGGKFCPHCGHKL